MKPTHLDIVVIVWDDAWKSATADYSLDDIVTHHKPAVEQTIGWLMKEDEEGITVANERGTGDGADQFRGVSYIPRKMIRSITHFKLTSPRKKRATPAPPAKPVD